jgi:hypothetical protein
MAQEALSTNRIYTRLRRYHLRKIISPCGLI